MHRRAQVTRSNDEESQVLCLQGCSNVGPKLVARKVVFFTYETDEASEKDGDFFLGLPKIFLEFPQEETNPAKCAKI